MEPKKDLKMTLEFKERLDKEILPVKIDWGKKLNKDFGEYTALYFGTIPLNIKEWKNENKDNIKMKYPYGFLAIQCHINPNTESGGKDYSEKMRTWNVQFSVKVDIRHYRCRNWWETEVFKLYEYGSSLEEVLENFKNSWMIVKANLLSKGIMDIKYFKEHN